MNHNYFFIEKKPYISSVLGQILFIGLVALWGVFSLSTHHYFLVAHGDTTNTNGNIRLVTSSISSPSVTQGSTATINLSLQDIIGSTTNAIVDLTIIGRDNPNKYHFTFTNQNLSASTTRAYTATTSSLLTPGPYRTNLDVFSSDHQTLVGTFYDVASFQVVSASSTPSNPDFTLNLVDTATTGSINTPFTVHGFFNNNSPNVGQGVADIEIYDSMGHKVFQQAFNQNFNTNQNHNYYVFASTWTPVVAGTYTVKLGAFNADWSKNYAWNNNAGTIVVSGGSTPGNGMIDVWWPGQNSHISGIQQFKALLKNVVLETYQMYWQVDGGQLNSMYNSYTDYPHKESVVDVSGWHWQPSGQYTIMFIAKNSSGSTIASQSTNFFVK